VVEVAIHRGRELERPRADIAEGLVVEAEDLIGGLEELVDGQGTVIKLAPVSDTFGDGTTKLVDNTVGILPPRLFDRSVPRPDPVPPPSEWTN
jgi:hypothetical protein